eukprot:scpid89718/ scgid20739/ 
MEEELDDETVGEETEDEADDGSDDDREDDERNEEEDDETDEEESGGRAGRSETRRTNAPTARSQLCIHTCHPVPTVLVCMMTLTPLHCVVRAMSNSRKSQRQPVYVPISLPCVSRRSTLLH